MQKIHAPCYHSNLRGDILDEIIVIEYDSKWSEYFEQEEAAIRDILPNNLVTRIEHFGSTAVPGLPAKPIVDILIGVVSLVRAREEAVEPLEAMGYSYWRDDPNKERLYLVKGLPPNGPRTHHVHIVEPTSVFWERLLFRDYLRTHNDAAVNYAALKYEFAAQFRDDREAYTQAKTAYIRSITEVARRGNEE